MLLIIYIASLYVDSRCYVHRHLLAGVVRKKLRKDHLLVIDKFSRLKCLPLFQSNIVIVTFVLHINLTNFPQFTKSFYKYFCISL